MAKKPTNIDQFIKDVNAEVEKFAKKMPDVLTIVALDARALIKSRFIQKGEMVNTSEEEVSFPAYSKQYAKKREKKGLSPKENRLVFTGNMLRSMQVIGSGIKEKKFIVMMGATTGEEQNKANWNSTQYGDIFKLSKKEQKILGKTFRDEIEKVLK